jgi:hypothetical protein
MLMSDNLKGMMLKTAKLIPALLTALLAAPVFAQSVATDVQRDVNQQQRIENGLKSGQLTTREAAKLEHQESRVDRAQANALKDGTVTDAEKTRIRNMQNQVSRDVYAEKHDAQIGNPNSASSKRMQADVQRNVNQEKRIDNGIKNGSLTNQEAAGLERSQAKIDRKEARAGRDGQVGLREQHRIQVADKHASRRIRHEKQDAEKRN